MESHGFIDREQPLFIVLNAASGRFDAVSRQTQIREVLERAGQRHEFLVVENSTRLPLVARRAVELAERERGVIVAAGGDGTINAVAQAVSPTGRPLGVLPQGTFNYFGRTYGIPSDGVEAVHALLRAKVRPVQLGLVNQRVFLVNASVGLYPQLLEERETYKRRFGRTRFVALCAAVLTILREHHTLVLQLEREGETRIMRTSTLFVGNNVMQLEQLGIAEAAAVLRGNLVAIAVRAVSKAGMLGLLARGALGQLGEAENIVTFAFDRLTVRLRRSYGRTRVKIATDGEIGWSHLPLEFRVAPVPLYLLAPEPAEDPAKAA